MKLNKKNMQKIKTFQFNKNSSVKKLKKNVSRPSDCNSLMGAPPLVYFNKFKSKIELLFPFHFYHTLDYYVIVVLSTTIFLKK